MVESIIISPDNIRAYGNIVDNNKTTQDFTTNKATVLQGTATINGETYNIFKNTQSNYNVNLGFDSETKQLYISTDDDSIITTFSMSNKCMVLDCDGNVITDFDLITQ